MARGFESKDVEFQQSEAERTKSNTRALTSAERDNLERRRSVELALARARAELATAGSAAHRRMLEQAIEYLEQQLASQCLNSR